MQEKCHSSLSVQFPNMSRLWEVCKSTRFWWCSQEDPKQPAKGSFERPFRGSSWGTPIQIVGMDPIPSTLKFKFKLVWYGCYLCCYFNCNKTKRILLSSLLKLPVLTKQNIETFHSKGEQVGKCVQPGWFVHGGSSRAGLKITSLRARIVLQSILQLNTSVQVSDDTSLTWLSLSFSS